MSSSSPALMAALRVLVLLWLSMLELSSFMLSAILENSIQRWLCSVARDSTRRSDSAKRLSVAANRLDRLRSSAFLPSI